MSRWQVTIEARDALLRVIAPALPLLHFLTHGARIAGRLRSHHKKRPAQLATTADLLRKCLS